MSDIILVRTKLLDDSAVQAACRRLGWPQGRHGLHAVFSRYVEGLAVQPPDWAYPVVCHLKTGELTCDHFEEIWGDPVDLDRLRQAYTIEQLKLFAQRAGHRVRERPGTRGAVVVLIERDDPVS